MTIAEKKKFCRKHGLIYDRELDKGIFKPDSFKNFCIATALSGGLAVNTNTSLVVNFSPRCLANSNKGPFDPVTKTN